MAVASRAVAGRIARSLRSSSSTAPGSRVTAVLVAAALALAYAAVFAVFHTRSDIWTVSVAYMLAFGVASWLLGRVGAVLLGILYVPFQLALDRSFGVDPMQFSGNWMGGSVGPAWTAVMLAFTMGFGWLVGAAGDYSRQARERSVELARKNEELQRTSAALAQSEEMFRLFAERVDVGTWIVPADASKPSYLNPSARKLFGAAAARPADKASWDEWLDSVHPMDRDALRASSDLLQQGLMQDIEYRARHGEDAYRWVRARSFPIADADGRVVSWVGLAEDVTDRKDAEARQESLQRRERLTALGTLVAGVAHEVNNPLTYLMGNMHLARDDVAKATAALAEAAPAEAERLRHVDKLLSTSISGGERIARIVKALRAVTQQRGAASARERVDLNGIATNVHELMRASLPPNVAFQLDVDARGAPVTVLGGSPELHQVMLNLATNAVQALGKRGGTVTLAARRCGERALLEVSDDGPGIPEDVRQRLFTPFFTTKADGTGLGLSIAHAIVREHDGDITVETAPGRGATFRVTLPLAPAVGAAASPATPARRGVAA